MATSSDALRRKIAEPGYTPSVRVLGDLLDLLGDADEDVATLGERAVLKIEAQYAERVAAETVTRARATARPARGRLTRLAGRLAHVGRDPENAATAWLVEALADGDPKTRRAAARALGKLPPAPAIQAALEAAWERADADDRKVLALALGKTGKAVEGEHGRASVIAAREIARKEHSAIDLARAHRGPIWLHTRSGLEGILEDELGGRFGIADPKRAAPGVVAAALDGPLGPVSTLRVATHFGFPLPPAPKSDDLARDVVTALASKAALALFRALTTGGKPRFRLAFVRGGHQRPVVWRIAELVRRELPELVNDPTESTWEVVVDDRGDAVAIELVPRGFADERFAYRGALVAAASHPAIAAALARAVPRRDDDVVWDPFAGAGSELVERARLAPYARLHGSDTDPRAVEAARANLARAGVANATIDEADALTLSPAGVTAIVTNPPMGRRVQRGAHAALLEDFVAHAARVLVPGGALAWLVPEPKRVHDRATREGFTCESRALVDMGGFSAELMVLLFRGAR